MRVRTAIAPLLALVVCAGTARATLVPAIPGWTAHVIVSGIPDVLPCSITADPATGDLFSINYGAAEGPVTLNRISPAGVVTTLAVLPFIYPGTLEFDATAHVLYHSTPSGVERRDAAGTLLSTIPLTGLTPLGTFPIAIGPGGRLFTFTSGGIGSIRIMLFDESLESWTPWRDVPLPPPYSGTDIAYLRNGDTMALDFDAAGRAYVDIPGGVLLRVDDGGPVTLGSSFFQEDMVVSANLLLWNNALYDLSGGATGMTFVVAGDVEFALAGRSGDTFYLVDRPAVINDPNYTVSIVAITKASVVPAMRTSWGALKSRFR